MILVTGIPRSGTSWIAKVLGYSNEVKFYYEPDNEHNSLLGYIHKQHLHRFPYIRANEGKNGLYTILKSTISDRYLYDYSKLSLAIKKLLNINLDTSELETKKKCNHLDSIKNGSSFRTPVHKIRVKTAQILYNYFQLFENHNKYKKLPLVKSVHCLLALPYIKSIFKAEFVIILRHPASIISSHLRLKNPDIYRNIFIQKKLVEDYFYPFIDKINALKDPLEKAGAQVAAFYYIIACQMKENSDWITVKHEDFCFQPEQEFKNLYNRLNLNWSDEIYDKIKNLNKDGRGYSTSRVARQQVNKWKGELEPSQVEKIRKGYGIIPPSFYKDFIHYKNSSV